jgi:thymidine kinase
MAGYIRDWEEPSYLISPKVNSSDNASFNYWQSRITADKKIGKITLILGPMFSGKSSMLQKHIHTYQCIERPVIAFNHSFDVRYGDNTIANHDGVKIDAIMTSDLSPYIPGNDREDSLMISRINSAELIAINEGQFFDGSLTTFCMYWREQGKNIVISALDGDYKQEMFAEIIRILPKADNFEKLNAKCIQCRDGTDAPFTFRKTTEKQQIIVGNQDIYKPLCWKCGQATNK